MNIFRVQKGYRQVGLGYGLPVFYIDFGLGWKASSEELLGKLVKMGLMPKLWVVLRGGLSERGIGELIYGLKYLQARVEVEASTDEPTPGWFPQADRWLIWYSGVGRFNLQALRTGQDMVVFDGEGKVEEFIGGRWSALKGIVTSDPDNLWELVKDTDIRVYQKKEKEGE